MRIATPLDGPRPGSAPMMVPMKQPPTASPSVAGVSATAKPCARCASSSIRRRRQPASILPNGARPRPSAYFRIANSPSDRPRPAAAAVRDVGPDQPGEARRRQRRRDKEAERPQGGGEGVEHGEREADAPERPPGGPGGIGAGPGRNGQPAEQRHAADDIGKGARADRVREEAGLDLRRAQDVAERDDRNQEAEGPVALHYCMTPIRRDSSRISPTTLFT